MERSKRNNRTEAVGVIDTCASQAWDARRERALNWNQRGPTGQPGQHGQPGRPGAKGATGAKGDKCDKGDKGTTAAAGPTGSQGEPGSDGSPGADGQNVTGTALPLGNSQCPSGGTSFAAANVTSYACHGSDGGAGFGTGYRTLSLNRVTISQQGNDIVSLTILNGAPPAAVYLTG
jgi:hypothetical protein